MNIIKRIGAALTGAKPEHALARDYPESNLPSAPAFSNYPQKIYLGDQGIFAHRMEFMVQEADANRIVNTLSAEFDLTSQDIFQEGHLATSTQSIHFSLRPEFGGVRVAIVTNSIKLVEGIDALALEPPAPWAVFPEADPNALGSLQGAMAYWWEWFFLPFWTSADANKRQRYFDAHPASQDWIDFLMPYSYS